MLTDRPHAFQIGAMTWGTTIAIGVALGTVFGVVGHNIGLGIGIGIAFGIALRGILAPRDRRRRR